VQRRRPLPVTLNVGPPPVRSSATIAPPPHPLRTRSPASPNLLGTTASAAYEYASELHRRDSLASRARVAGGSLKNFGAADGGLEAQADGPCLPNWDEWQAGGLKSGLRLLTHRSARDTRVPCGVARRPDPASFSYTLDMQTDGKDAGQKLCGVRLGITWS
jgi:hypothetical protein